MEAASSKLVFSEFDSHQRHQLSKIINIKDYKKDKEKKLKEEQDETEGKELMDISIIVKPAVSDRVILEFNKPVNWIRFDEASFKEILENIRNSTNWDI